MSISSSFLSPLFRRVESRLRRPNLFWTTGDCSPVLGSGLIVISTLSIAKDPSAFMLNSFF